MALGFAQLKRFKRVERFKMTVNRGKTIPYVDDTITIKVVANVNLRLVLVYSLYEYQRQRNNRPMHTDHQNHVRTIRL